MTPQRNFMLSDPQWDALLLRCPKLEVRDRPVLEAVLYALGTATPWQDLPDGRGMPSGRTVQRHYHRWLRSGVWPELLEGFLDTLSPLEAQLWRAVLERAALLRRAVLERAALLRSVRSGRGKRPVLALP